MISSNSLDRDPRHHSPGQPYGDEGQRNDQGLGLGTDTGDEENEALLPSPTTASSSTVRNGKKKATRRNSNSNGKTGGGRSGHHRRHPTVQQYTSRLCIAGTTGIIVITFLFYLYFRPATVDSGGLPTNGDGSGTGSGDPHVVIPADQPWKLPPPTGLPRNEAFLTKAESGAVASEDVTCSQMGTDILRKGGNAVDAAITTTICIGLLNAFSSGIGGGGFMVVRVPSRSEFIDERQKHGDGLPWSEHTESRNNSKVTAIDFRETSPEASHKDLYIPIPGSSQVGGLSVGVPGELRGLQTAFERYGSGRFSWDQLFEPNVKLARGGWRVSRELARRFRIFGQFMVGKPEWEATYRPRGEMLVEGDWMNRQNYSIALEEIGKNGADYFYKDSWIAEEIIQKVKEEGGIMTKEDLEGYKPRVYDAIEGSYHGRKVYTTDAPSCGPMLLMMLNSLEPYNLSREGGALSKSTRTPLNMHRIVESLKYAFARRTEIGDLNTSYTDKKRTERIASFSTKEFGREINRNITDDTTHDASYYDPIFDVPQDSGTTHLSVVDRWGGAVSLTSTVNLIFGSRVMTTRSGIILNDEQDDFSIPGEINAFGLPPSPYNYPEAGKRPLSSTSPMIAEYEDGSFYAAMGGSGGSRIFGAVAQSFLNLEWGMDISEAIEAPRVHDQLFPPTVTIESDFDQTFIDGLKSKGHNITMFDINLGVAEVQAVMQDRNGTVFAASDSRKNGRSWGY